MTTGTWMFIGGLAGAVILLILLLIRLFTAGKERRKLLEKIQKEW